METGGGVLTLSCSTCFEILLLACFIYVSMHIFSYSKLLYQSSNYFSENDYHVYNFYITQTMAYYIYILFVTIVCHAQTYKRQILFECYEHCKCYIIYTQLKLEPVSYRGEKISQNLPPRRIFSTLVKF